MFGLAQLKSWFGKSQSSLATTIKAVEVVEERATSMAETTGTLSTFYVSHGSPMMPLEDIPVRDFFATWTERYPTRPKAILAISAHWDTHEPAVNVVSKNSTIHDFYNFPRELYQLQYTPPGAPDVARRVKALLQRAGFSTVLEDPKRGLDHGSWTPLMLMYPEADIPVFQLSIQSHKSGKHHYDLGRALAPLRDEGVLIFASGTSVHNLRELQRSSRSGAPTVWAKAFDGWLDDVLLNNKHEEAVEWEKAPYARKAHPHPDHLLPVYVALGAAGEQCKAEKIYEEFTMGLALSCYEFKAASS